MILEPGSKVLVCHRRMFEGDQPRLFIGVTDVCEGGLAKVSGFTWTRDPTHGYQRKSDRRTKILALASGTIFVYELPSEVEIEALRIEQHGGHQLILTDGAKFSMDVAERQTGH